MISLIMVSGILMQPQADKSTVVTPSSTIISENSVPIIENENAILVIQVNRSVSITQHGLVQVIDTYLVRNLLPLSKSYIQIADLDSREPFIYAHQASSNGITLAVKEQVPIGDGLIKWNVYLNNPLLPGETVEFTVSTTYGDLIDYSQYATYFFWLLKYPISPYHIASYETSITTMPTTVASATTSYTGTDRDPLSSEVFTFQFNLNVDTPGILECISLDREITFDQWGFIYIKEKHRIKNLGDLPAYSWSFRIPADFVPNSVRVYDSTSVLYTNDLTFDPIWDIISQLPWFPTSTFFSSLLTLSNHIAEGAYTTQSGSSGYQTVTVYWAKQAGSPGNRRALEKNEETFYWIEYRLPYENYIQFIGDEHFFSGKIVFFEQYYWKIDRATIDYKLPFGVSIQSVSPAVPEIITQGGRITLRYNYENVTLSNDITVQCQFNSVGSYLLNWWRPILIVGIISLVLFAYVIARRELPSEKLVIKRPKVVVPKIIREFVEIYMEKIAHNYEMEKLESDLQKGKIHKREYRTRYKLIDQKILGLDKEVKGLKDEMRNAGGTYQSIVDKIELREAERDQQRESLKLLEVRYRQRKRVTPTAYRKLRTEIEKKISKAKNSIDRLLAQLRDLL